MLYIEIIVDINDGDYFSKLSEISESQVEEIAPVVQAINEFKPSVGQYGHISHNFPRGDYVRDDLGELSAYTMYHSVNGYDLFNTFLPDTEYGFHTIKLVRILNVVSEEVLIDTTKV